MPNGNNNSNNDVTTLCRDIKIIYNSTNNSILRKNIENRIKQLNPNTKNNHININSICETLKKQNNRTKIFKLSPGLATILQNANIYDKTSIDNKTRILFDLKKALGIHYNELKNVKKENNKPIELSRLLEFHRHLKNNSSVYKNIEKHHVSLNKIFRNTKYSNKHKRIVRKYKNALKNTNMKNTTMKSGINIKNLKVATNEYKKFIDKHLSLMNKIKHIIKRKINKKEIIYK